MIDFSLGQNCHWKEGFEIICLFRFFVRLTACIKAAQLLLDKGYEPAFVAGLLANICKEGDTGLFEYAYRYNPDWKAAYIQYMVDNYNYYNEYQGQFIYHKDVTKVYNILMELKSKGLLETYGFGLGCIQWTKSRTLLLVETYREVNGNSSKITFDQARDAEGLTMVKELDGGFHKVYTDWKNNNSPLKSQESAYWAGDRICKNYEMPDGMDEKGAERGNLAKNIYADMMK